MGTPILQQSFTFTALTEKCNFYHETSIIGYYGQFRPSEYSEICHILKELS